MFVGKLREFQVEAVERMLERKKLLVAYTMGMGKTPITIAAVEQLLDSGTVSCGLVVVPASLKYQWRREIEKFTGGQAYALVIDGSPTVRKKQYQRAMQGEHDYIILNYEQVVNDWEYVRELPRDFVICDEVTALKGFKTKRSRRVKKLQAPYLFGLSGQPLENRPEEVYCVDAVTEVLSVRGWLRHDQLQVGDVVLTLNHGTGMSEWQPVQAVNEFVVKDQSMVSMEHKSHSSLTTPNHRWPVERVRQARGHIVDRKREWAISDSFRWGDRVPIAAACADLPVEPTHSDALVELIAWLYTEGGIRKQRDGSFGTAVNITQNTDTVTTPRIRRVLSIVFGAESGPFPRTGQQIDGIPRWREDSVCRGTERVSVFKLNTAAGAQLLAHAPRKVPSQAFLLSLTQEQLELFIHVSMLGDNNGPHWFSQKSRACAEAFQLACILAGHATSMRPNPRIDYDRNGEPYQMTTVCVRRQRYLSPGQTPRLGKPVPYTGIVWCPTTPNGTWLARRAGSVYFTGNSIMQWVDDEVLGRYDIFDRAFIVRAPWGAPVRYKNLHTLHNKLSEAMVRKTWDDVPDDEKPRVVEPPPMLVQLDPASRHLYRTIAQDLQADLAEALATFGSFNLLNHYASLGGDGNEMVMRGQIMAKLTCLRMLCDHPELLKISAEKFDDEDIAGGSQYASELRAAGLLDNLQTAPKLKFLLSELDGILRADPRSKVVVFSFFKPTLSIIQEQLDVGSVLFTGDMNAKEKDAAKLQFQTDPATRVFLSSDAGGMGLDLPEANYLVNYDLPWSVGKLDQRNARIVRLSTEWSHVTILSTLIAGSIEQRQYEMLEQKGRIASAVVDGKGIDQRGQLVLDLQTLSSFLEDSEI